MWPDRYQTSRSVWTTSAIAAATIHAGMVGWGITVWRAQRVTVQPASIRVIALSTNPNSGFTASSSAEAEVSPANSASEQFTQDFSPAPVAPVDDGTRQSTPISPANTPVTTQTETERSQTTSAPPVSPSEAGLTESTTPNTAPTEPSSSPAEIPPLPPVDPNQNADLISPPVGEESPTDVDIGLQTHWTLREQGGDIPQESPKAPPAWAQAMNTVLNTASCSSELVATGSTLRATVRPVIEADGFISSIRPVSLNDLENSDILIRCLQAIAPQIPPLIPARDGGVPIVSDVMILLVEVQPIR